MERLDYCNRLLGGAPKCLLSPLSGVLRAAAHLTLLPRRKGSLTDRIRTELHWLDIPSRVTFEFCVFAYRCLHGSTQACRFRYRYSFYPLICSCHSPTPIAIPLGSKFLTDLSSTVTECACTLECPTTPSSLSSSQWSSQSHSLLSLSSSKFHKQLNNSILYLHSYDKKN